ncbi:hypothetical protein GCM10027088_43770 [Nocardia goodfellowii]
MASLGGLATVLEKADIGDKLEVYRQLGLKPTFDHATRAVVAEVQLQPPVGILDVSGGGIDHYAHAIHQRTRFHIDC